MTGISMQGKWPKVMLLSAATSAWLAYDIISAPEAPRQALAVLQYALLACAVCALVGSAVMAATDR
jgi:hypothetical protein